MHRSASTQAHLRNGNASRRHQFPHPDEVAWPLTASDDHALCRRCAHRSPARVSTSTCPPEISGSTAQGIITTAPRRTRWRHRITSRRSACPRRCSVDPSPKATRDHASTESPTGYQRSLLKSENLAANEGIKTGRDWPVMSPICQIRLSVSYLLMNGSGESRSRDASRSMPNRQITHRCSIAS